MIESNSKICVFQGYKLQMRNLFRRIGSGLLAPSLTLLKPKPTPQNEDEDTRKEI